MTFARLLLPFRCLLVFLGTLGATLLGGCGEAPVPPVGLGAAERDAPTPDSAEPTVLEVASVAETAAGPGASEPAGVDLLAWIDPRRDAVAGEWSQRDGALLSPGTDGARLGARLVIPCTVPAEYRLKIVVERVGGDEMFGIGLAASGRQFMAVFESHYEDRISSGLALVDGERIPENPTTRLGRVFHEGGPTTIEVTVTTDHVRVTADGEEVVNFRGPRGPRGPFDRLLLPESWLIPGKAKLFLASWKCRYRITALELTPLSGDVPTLAAVPAVQAVQAVQAVAAIPAVAPAASDEAKKSGAADSVTLADGTVLPLQTWGETYEARVYRLPLNGDDWKLNDPRDISRGFHKADPRIETVYDAFGKPPQKFRGSTIGEAARTPGQLQFDPKHHALYWTDRPSLGADRNTHLHRLDLKTGRLETLFVAWRIGSPTLDLMREKIYWFECNDKHRHLASLRRANLDGTEAETLLIGIAGGTRHGLAIDSEKEYLYFSGEAEVAPGIFRMKLDELHADGVFNPKTYHRLAGSRINRLGGLDMFHTPLCIALDP